MSKKLLSGWGIFLICMLVLLSKQSKAQCTTTTVNIDFAGAHGERV